ncbi:autotransporter family protein [Maricaulis virginensis]|uniref:Autotransporter protein n=1 Tax=Maricaulis virginensis TaxID=144022 RepID=A0A9W6MNB3_9PROT|nr:autotransporter outer membrane beta-barrel domain-containing protein [Maricaulis virginensis]GLK52420.1 autotransporter protein [Maricaulis virginensis]
MRRRLMFASAIATLTVAAPSALADRQINDEITTPIATSTAGSGGVADNIVITANGRVTLSTPGTAVTLDSSNDVTVDGAIDVVSDDDGGIGVHVVGGNTGNLTISGPITVESESDPEDDGEDEDSGYSDLDGPSAIGGNRIGVLVDGDGAFVGDIYMDSSGSIIIRGNDSAGIRVLTGIEGEVRLEGSISIIGDRSVGIDIQDTLTGDFAITSSVAARGEDSSAIVLAGDVGGAFYLNSAVSTTGYQFSSYTNNEEYLATLDEDDVFQAAATILIQSSIEDGILFDAPTDDNRVSRTATVSHRGEAPAVQILASDGNITFGEVIQPAVEDDDTTEDEDESVPETPLGYSWVNRGSITTTSDLNDTSSTGILIGGGDDGNGSVFTAELLHGFLNTGSISATSFSDTIAATAVALHLEEGAILPILTNEGAISSTSQNTVDATAFGSAYTIVIEDGAVLEELVNSGQIVASGSNGGSGYAIVDRSGTLRSIENTGRILASHIPRPAYYDADGDLIEPDDNPDYRTVALDVSNNTTGVTYRQHWEAVPDDGDDNTTEPTVLDASIYMIGDVLFGTGDDTLTVEAGRINGAISFGDGQDALVVDGSTVHAEILRLIEEGIVDPMTDEEIWAALPYITSAISDSDGNLSIALDFATLELVESGDLEISDAHFGDGSVLMLQVDAENNDVRRIVSSGNITFETGSRLSVSLSNLIGGGGTFELVRAGSLTIEEDLDTLNDSPSPYLYNTSLERSADDDNVIVLTLERKDADALGMNANQAAAYASAFESWAENGALGAAIASLTNQNAFFDAYDQLLPEYAASAIQFAMASNDSAIGALANRLEAVRRSPEETGGLWVQEFGYFADRAGTAFGPGYRGQGLGVAVGFDRPVGPFYAVGVNFVGAASEVSEVEGVDDPMTALTGQLGAYAGSRVSGVNFDIYGGAGFDSFEHNRRVVIGEFDASPSAEWTGYHITGSARVSRDFEFGGRYYARPALSVDYLHLFEEGYTETGGGIGVDLSIADRDSTSFTGSAVLTMGALFENSSRWWSPVVRLGYRSEFSNDILETEARFADYDDTFILRSQQLPGSGLLFGFGVSAGSGYSTFSLDYDADVRDDFIRHTARLVMRMVF